MRETPAPLVTGWQRGFWSLMGTQFQNAFSDNALKQLIILMLLASAVATDEDKLVSVVTAVFSAPFIMFAMLGLSLIHISEPTRPVC
jgi:hypothetical protein